VRQIDAWLRFALFARKRVELSVAHIEPLLRGAVLRKWDLARAAKAEKVGFSAEI
jgi:hypothetical protein